MTKKGKNICPLCGNILIVLRVPKCLSVALHVQLASLNAPRARDSIVTLRAPFCLDLALCARSYILRIHVSLFLVIWYWSSIQFYNIVDVLSKSELVKIYLIISEIWLIQIAKKRLLRISLISLITSVKSNWFNCGKYCFH